MLRNRNGSRKPHARAPYAQTTCWFAHGSRKRAVYEPPRQRNVYSTAPLRNFCETLRNDAVESMLR
eukprot:7149307-Lingulodinium_polyedra.AAC.1